MTKSLPYPKI